MLNVIIFRISRMAKKYFCPLKTASGSQNYIIGNQDNELFTVDRRNRPFRGNARVFMGSGIFLRVAPGRTAGALERSTAGPVAIATSGCAVPTGR
jgi:hypothetical protein